ncbi:MAG: multicopper oxidase domain-containing protein [Acaryochloridaceae cyanobacterium RU_4_10]|nr:multicopper oxidase domain-containing protein [Acaryochloridaceae cyanobacterium RU_4_10]
MKITRREAIKVVGGGILLSPFAYSQPAHAQFSSAVPRFQIPLKLPPLLSPSRSNTSGDRPIDYYEITMQKAEVDILPGMKTKMWCYVGKGLAPAAVGPIIRHRGGIEPEDEGRTSVIRFINKLGTTIEQGKEKPIDTSIHLHGMASLPEYDGYATDLIPPEYFKDYFYPNDRAATLWYHDHAVHKTSRNVYMGLAGMYVVDDAKARALNLPKGDYDIPLIIQDKKFDAAGQLIFDDHRQRSAYGDVALVNGTPFPRLRVARRKYRFRLLNASPSRTYQLVLSQAENTLTGGDFFHVISTDAGLLEKPVKMTAPLNLLRIGIGERYGIVIDFKDYPKGSKLYLQNPAFPNNVDTNNNMSAIVRFDIEDDATDDSSLPDVLRQPFERLVDQIQPGQTIPTRTFRFERNGNEWKINNKTWDENRIDANPQPGAIEIWNLVNLGGGWVHPVHIHFVDLQMIDRNGLPPRPYELGWKDVFLLDDFETIRVIAKFSSPQDRTPGKRPILGKYMMHCHNLVHEDHDMMTQFEIGAGGDDPKKAKAQPISMMKPF